MYIKKIFKLLSSEAWRIFIFGWIRVVIFKQKFYSQKYKDLSFIFPEPLVFLWQFKEIFVDECYDMPKTIGTSLLIDCGANVGMCSLYWARKFPDSKIVAIEADPKVAKILQSNLDINNVKNVTILNKAAWIYDGEIEFVEGPIDGGAIGSSSKNNSSKIPCFNLSTWLGQFQEVDYLKIDIEGAEVEVIENISVEILRKIKNIFIEYHQPKVELSEIGKMLWRLESNGFSCFITKVILAPKNLGTSKMVQGNGFFSQCNLHGIRTEKIIKTKII